MHGVCTFAIATFVLADDTFDQKLIHDVFPPEWKNPSSAALYDPVIVGGGLAGMGADAFLGAGRFKGPDQLEVQGQVLRFRKAVIAAGTEPTHLDVPGLQEAVFLLTRTFLT